MSYLRIVCNEPLELCCIELFDIVYYCHFHPFFRQKRLFKDIFIGHTRECGEFKIVTKSRLSTFVILLRRRITKFDDSKVIKFESGKKISETTIKEFVNTVEKFGKIHKIETPDPYKLHIYTDQETIDSFATAMFHASKNDV